MRVASALIAGVLAASPGAAWAQRQIDTGSHIAVPTRAEIPEDRTKEDTSRIVMRDFARCTYAHYAKQVADGVMLEPGLEGAALSNISTSDCLDSGMIKFPAPVMRGALFGELYRRHQQSTKPWALPVQALTLTEVPTINDSQSVRTNFLMLYLAQCIHQTAPEQMRQVVLQPVTSKGQEQAFAAIIPLLGDCLPQGMKVTLNRMTLESAFAEYLYRSQAPATAVAGNS